MNTKFDFQKALKPFALRLKEPLFLIIVGFCWIWLYPNLSEKNRIESYFNAPEIGDVYLIENSDESDTSYAFLRLNDMDSTQDSFFFYWSQKLYPQIPSKLADDDYFVAEERLFMDKDLRNLFKEHKIIYIKRNYDIPISYQKIKPPQKATPKNFYVPSDTSTKVWQTLLSLSFEISFDEKSDDVLFKPMYTEAIRKLDGRRVTLKAFMYAQNDSDGSILLSAYCVNPQNTCGSFNAESIVEIPKMPNLIFEPCRSCIVRGELSLNRDDYLKTPYSLTNIDFIRCEDLERSE